MMDHGPVVDGLGQVLKDHDQQQTDAERKQRRQNTLVTEQCRDAADRRRNTSGRASGAEGHRLFVVLHEHVATPDGLAANLGVLHGRTDATDGVGA